MSDVGPDPSRRTRSPRHIKAAAKILQKEARRILAKHAGRIAPEPAEAILAGVAAIDDHRARERWVELESEAETLDELLHQHASFARKSAIRETVENIAIAVFIALGLRSCFYEPFKIPSGSMLPTLEIGDHIFVNKFVYGVQIPFTNTVIGESLGEIERGDVVVFRFPLDESEDFIKRVIGLPGDQVRVSGRSVAIRKAGEREYEDLSRTALAEPCHDDDFPDKVLAGCQMFEEHLGSKTYVVRYTMTPEEHEEFMPRGRTWKVPAGHLLVMGDNRNSSHDSLQWTVRVEAVSADSLIGLKDLRDLTSDRLFSLRRPEDVDELGDPQHDHVTYLSSHRSSEHDISLAAWRDPPLSAAAVFEGLVAQHGGGRVASVAELVQGHAKPAGADLDRTLQVGADIDELRVGHDQDAAWAIAYIEPLQAVVELRCGTRVCKHDGRLAERLTEAVERLERNTDKDARELLERPEGVRYVPHWSGRSDLRDHYYATRFVHPQTTGEAGTVELFAFRKPKEPQALVEASAFAALGSSLGQAKPVPDLGPRSWMVEQRQGFALVHTDEQREITVVLRCGRSRCRSGADLREFGAVIAGRLESAAADRRQLKALLTAADVPGFTEDKPARPARDPFDQIRYEATVQGQDHSVEIEVWLRPSEGIAAKLAATAESYGLQPDDAVAQGGRAADEADAFHFAFAVEASDTVVRVRCYKGLCPERSDGVELARRAAQKAIDPSHFIDPDAERPRPFVPRGNVKGRAERIWLPLSRFWLPIR